MHHPLFTDSQHLELGALTRYAALIELDMRRFSAELGDRSCLQRAQKHRRSGERLALRGSH